MSRIALGIAILSVLATAATAQPEQPDFTVRLLNWSSTPAGEIRQAIRIADHALQQTGFRVRWLDCTPDAYGFTPVRGCQFKAGPTHLQLSLRRRVPRRLPVAVLGQATYPERGFPHRATIYVQRVRTLALSNGAACKLVLGYVIVHEIGHLLLDEHSHSRSGLMKSRWSGKDLVSAGRGNLNFSAREINRIRSGVNSRQIATDDNKEQLLIAGRAGARPNRKVIQ